MNYYPSTKTILILPHRLLLSSHTDYSYPPTQTILILSHRLFLSSHIDCSYPPTQTILILPHRLFLSFHIDYSYPPTKTILILPHKDYSYTPTKTILILPSRPPSFPAPLGIHWDSPGWTWCSISTAAATSCSVRPRKKALPACSNGHWLLRTIRWARTNLSLQYVDIWRCVQRIYIYIVVSTTKRSQAGGI